MASLRLRAPGFLIVVLLVCGLNGAAGAAQPVAVKDAWVRAPAPGQKIAGAYMELTGRVRCALVSVASPVAARGELHSTALENGVMKMRPVGRIELAAGQSVRLEPGGLHIMLVDLQRPLKAGEKVPLTLTVQRADFSRAVFTVQADVRDAAGAAAHHH